MSNPYAPPEDRPRAPEDAPAGGDGRPPATPPAQHPAPPETPVWPTAGGSGQPGFGVPQGPAGAPQGPVGVPHEPGAPAPDPVAAARVGRLAGTFGLLVIASVLVATLDLPWRVASAGFAVLAVVWGVRALRVALRARLRGGLPTMLVVGILVAGGWVLLSLTRLAMWDAERANQECVAQAITVAAQQECARQFRDDVQQRSRDLQDRMRRQP